MISVRLKLNFSRITRRLLTLIVLAGLVSCASQSDGDLSRKIARFAKYSKGKHIGRGECWDLAQKALDKYGADWNRPYQFGRKLRPEEPIQPGDIIQFDSAVLEWKRDNQVGKMWLGLPTHTGIAVAAEGTRIRMAHQNATTRVRLEWIDLSDITSGRYEVFRPVRKM